MQNTVTAVSAAQRELTSLYESLEREWKVSDRRADYGRLVVPAGNSQEAIHRWFHVKEAYSSYLLPRLLKDSDWTPAGSELSLLDPFSGSGTTSVSGINCARDLGLDFKIRAVETNPVLRTVSRAKVLGALYGRGLLGRLTAEYDQLLQRVSKYNTNDSVFLETESATLNNAKFYDPEHRDMLLLLGYLANRVEDSDVKPILQLCVAGAVEAAGLLRRDGRALRYTPKRTAIDPLVTFSLMMQRCAEDLSGLIPRGDQSSALVWEGDARSVHRQSESGGFEWIVFSPPYPNNIDYTEVYKTEGWALGTYSDVVEMRAQRLATIRSHSSVYFPEIYQYSASPVATEVQRLVETLCRTVPIDRYERGRRQMISGYIDDMHQVLCSTRTCISSNGRLALVVGNSLHGKAESPVLIASDVLLARLGELSGWQVEEIRVARDLRRRGSTSKFMRESVVILSPT